MEGLSNLGIDFKNILFYIVNIGILVAVLWYLLYDPIINVLNSRQKTISDTIEEANKIKAEFEKKLAEMQEAQLEMQAQLKSEVDQMNKFIEQRKAELISEMEAEKTALLEKANADISRRQAELVKDTEKQLLTVIKKIILEIVNNKVPAETINDSVSEAWKQYTK
jgi:F-type H+-transporting ATPase subunit b